MHFYNFLLNNSTFIYLISIFINQPFCHSYISPSTHFPCHSSFILYYWNLRGTRINWHIFFLLTPKKIEFLLNIEVAFSFASRTRTCTLNVSSAPLVAPTWKTKVTTISTTSCTVTSMPNWLPWTTHQPALKVMFLYQSSRK